MRGSGNGKAVLSRRPILRHVNHDLSQTSAEPRGLLHRVVARTVHHDAAPVTAGVTL